MALMVNFSWFLLMTSNKHMHLNHKVCTVASLCLCVYMLFIDCLLRKYVDEKFYFLILKATCNKNTL